MGPPVLAPAWQQPHVNVFKLCDVDNMKEVEVLGDVQEHMDRIIGKKVFKIRGLVSAANYMRLPKLKSQTLGLTGRFLYMQLKVSPVKVFVLHLEVVTEDLVVHRISISSMYKAEQLRRKSNGIQIPFPPASHRWCIAAVDLAGALSRFSTSPFHSLRSVQLCSWLTVRSMYTSDHKFSLQTLPREMALSHALDSSVFEFLWLPREPMNVPDADTIPIHKMPMERMSPAASRRNTAESLKGGTGGKLTATPSPADSSGLRPPPQTPTETIAALQPVFAVSADSKRMSAAAAELAAELSVHSEVPVLQDDAHATAHKTARAVAPRPDAASSSSFTARTGALGMDTGGMARTAAQSDTLRRIDQDGTPDASDVLEPDPALSLLRINSFNGDQPRSMVWPPHSDEVVFAAGSVAVAMSADGAHQRFFMGHTAHVIAFAFDGEGALMATAQDGKQAVIRLWAYQTGQCIAILNGHANGLLCLDISQDGRALVGVGLDPGCKQLMVLWDISQLRYGGKPEVVARQTTEYNIRAIKFSAYEEDQLVTCGQDNVRVYRLKGGQLRGVTVRIGGPDKKVTMYAGGLVAALGPNVFTDIAFDAGVGVYQSQCQCQHIYVSSASGALFKIDYNTRTLLCVFQLHSAAINSLVMGHGFCVTGGDDNLLRVWPMEFNEHLLQADHEAGVSSVALSPDGLRVAIGTESGAIGLLDVPTHQYTTLLRSHLGCVNGIAVNPSRDEYCTASSDGTIRVWALPATDVTSSVTGHQQRLEFDAPGEQVLCVAYHPLQQELAAGFANGRLRVFDLESVMLIQEHQQHRAALLQLVYAPNGTRLYTAGADGGLCVYDVAQLYQPTKFLCAGLKDAKVCVAVSPDGRYLATVSHDPYRAITSLLLFHGDTLQPYMRIETDVVNFTRLAFSPDGHELWVLAHPNRLDRYELLEGQLLQQVSCAHRLEVCALSMDPYARFVATGGHDGLVKLWGITCSSGLGSTKGSTGALQKRVPPNQAFGGHPSAVLDAAVKGNFFITVGDDDCVFIWRINCQTPRATTVVKSAAGAYVVAGPNATSTAQSPAATRVLSNPHVSAATSPPNAGQQQVTRASVTPHDAPSPSDGQALASAAAAERVLAATAVTYPAPTPGFSNLVGYTPNGLSQNVVWDSRTGLFAYAVDHIVVVEDLASRKQTYLTHFTQPVAVLAASADGKLLAAAPSACEPSLFADVVIWAVPSGARMAVLQYHPVAVEALSFSPCGRYLLSVGRDPERAVVVWDLPHLSSNPSHRSLPAPNPAPNVPRYMAGNGRTRFPVSNIRWLPAFPGAPPQFMSVGGDGLLLWSLKPDCLEQVPICLPTPTLNPNAAQPTGSPSHRATTAIGVDPQGIAIVADSQGCVWEVQLGHGGLAAISHVATLPGCEVTRIITPPASSSSNESDNASVVLATVGGLLTVYSRARAVSPVTSPSGINTHGTATSSSYPAAPVWSLINELHLDGTITAACFEPGLCEAIAATTSSTVWYCNVHDDWRLPLVGGHAAAIQQLCTPSFKRASAGAAKLLASCAKDGALRIWKLGHQVEPVAEMQSTGGACCCAALISCTQPNSQTNSPRPGAQPSQVSSPSCSPQHSKTKGQLQSVTQGSEGPGVGVLGGFEDGSLRLFTLTNGCIELQWRCARHKSPVVAVRPHPTGRWLLSASEDGGLAITHVATSRLVVYLEHLVHGSQQQQLLQRQQQSSSAALAALDASTGAAAHGGSQNQQADPLCAVDVSPADATMCAAAWRSRLLVFTTPWDDSTMHTLAQYNCEQSTGALSVDVPAAVQFVPKSTKLVAYTSPLLLGRLLLFDYRKASVTRSIACTQMLRCMALASDGQLAVAGGMGGAVFVIDVASGTWVELQGTRGPVVSAVFDTDDNRVVTCNGRAMQVWHVAGLLDMPAEELRRSKLL